MTEASLQGGDAPDHSNRFDYAATGIGVDLLSVYEVTKIILDPLSNQTTRLNTDQIRLFTSITNGGGSWSEHHAFAIELLTDGNIEITLHNPVDARYVKVLQPYNERDGQWEVNVAEFANNPQELITVYYNAPTRTETYTYDDAGNRTSKSITLIDTESSTYRHYPGTTRLMTDGTWAYQYDANGNRTHKGDTIMVNGTPTSVVDVSDWSAFTASTAGQVGSITFADTGEQWNYTYTRRNQMETATKNGETIATYRHDARGLRLTTEKPEHDRLYTVYGRAGEIMYQEEGSEGREFVYLGNDHVSARKGTIAANGSLTDTERVWLHTDQVGSIVAITDEAGETVWHGDFTPFGEVADTINESEWGWVFGGKGYDADVELYYFNARWYDATTGQFTSEDPARDGGNWYAYVGSNPLVYRDPTGLRRTREERRADRAERRQRRADKARDKGKDRKADRIESRMGNTELRHEKRDALKGAESRDERQRIRAGYNTQRAAIARTDVGRRWHGGLGNRRSQSIARRRYPDIGDPIAVVAQAGISDVPTFDSLEEEYYWTKFNQTQDEIQDLLADLIDVGVQLQAARGEFVQLAADLGVEVTQLAAGAATAYASGDVQLFAESLDTSIRAAGDVVRTWNAKETLAGRAIRIENDLIERQAYVEELTDRIIEIQRANR